MEGFLETLTLIFSTLFFLSCLVVLCVTISLKTRSTGHSIGLSMAAMLSIVFLPLLFGTLTFDSDGFEFFAIFTPGTWIVAMPFESHMRREVGSYPVYAVVVTTYALITLALKEGAIKQFDTITGRQEN